MAIYGVTVSARGGDWVAYEGSDAAEAERIAIREHKRFRGQGYVSVMLDGGTWKDVKHVPGDLATSQLCEPSCCLHLHCGQINPLSCFCGDTMDAESRAFYADLG